MSKDIDSDRRGFLKLTALAGTAIFVSGVPLVSYVVAPALNKGIGKWVALGSADSLTPGGTEMLPYEFMVKDGWQVLPQRGFVWAKSETDGRLTVFSSTCTHLACNVVWREDEGVFQCPCHSGRFDADGRPIAGPPTKPLAVLEHKIEDGDLHIFLTV